MRVLADLFKDTEPANNFLLVELIAAQVVAAAAYKGLELTSLDQIKSEVSQVAGYPMLNRMSGGVGRQQSDVGTEAAYRIAAIVGVAAE